MKNHKIGARSYFYTAGNPINYLVSNEENQTQYTYDKHGNILSMPHLSKMIWDFRDRLVNTVRGDDSTYYTYDIAGNRVRKITLKSQGITEERIYLGGYEIFRKRDSSGDIDIERQTVYVEDENKKIVLVDTKIYDEGEEVVNPVSNFRYQYNNHLGSACLELDDEAAIISYEEYHPFGTTSYRSGRNEVEVSLKRFKYVGKERDEETGLYYYGARYYAAWLGRFVSVDPLQHKYPNYTPYQYAGNKPISYIDLDGLEEKKNDEIAKLRPIESKNVSIDLNYKAEEKVDKEGFNKFYQGLKFASEEEFTNYVDFKNLVKNRSAGKDQYSVILKELEIIENNSDVVFRIRMGGNTTGKSGAGSNLYNSDKGEIEINIRLFGDKNINQKFAHELKHASQFIERKLGYGKGLDVTYDLQDELEAWHRADDLFSDSMHQAWSDKAIQDHYDLSFTDRNYTVDDYQRNNPGYWDNIINTNKGRLDRNQKPKFMYHGWKEDIPK